jgi:hypothetical protein
MMRVSRSGRTAAVLAAAGSLAAIIACGASASARLPGGGGAVEVGGTVPSFLGLTVTQPSGLRVFPVTAGAHSYTSSFDATVTSTDDNSQLSVLAEQHGHLISGSSILALPLQAAVAGRPYVSLDAPVGVLLQTWTGPLAGKRTTIKLLQRVTTPPPVSGPYRSVLLITVAEGTP